MLKVEVIASVGIIRIDRAEKRNAISFEMLSQIDRALDGFDASVKVIMLTSTGDNFSAGLDLQSTSSSAPPDLVQSMEGIRRWEETMRRIRFGSRPVISALKGAVIGGGLELAACTHIRVADDTAFFQLPEGKLGVFVGGGATVSVSRIIGPDRVMELLLTGRRMAADEAERIGIVHYRTDTGGAEEKALEIAHQVAENHDFSNYLAIHAPARIDEMSDDQGFFTEQLAAILVRTSQESQERLSAFLNRKRTKK